MWLDPFFTDKGWQDAAATAITLAAALAWLRSVEALAARGWLEPRLSRKIIHIGTGPLFVVCWNLFSAQPAARWAAAVVPLAITAQFAAVGLGWLKDDAAVQAMTRSGDRREILRGPLFYGAAFVVCTVVFWRSSPAGLLALMAMCGGDGLADIVGRRLGGRRLPFNPGKSWAGSAAMFVGSWLFGLAFVVWFAGLGHYPLAHPPADTAARVAGIALAGTVVEALPFGDIDNLSVTAAAALLGMWLL